MKQRQNFANMLAKEVEVGRYNQRSSLFVKLSAKNLQDFSKLELDENSLDLPTDLNIK